MNLTDLTTELQARSELSQPSPAMARLTGVRQRIRARRRRQAASAAGLVLLCVAAVFLAPGGSDLHADQTPEPATTVTPSPTSAALEFATQLGQDPLIASAVGRRGETELVLRFTPTDTNLAMSSFCRLDRPAPTGSVELFAETTINGHSLSGVTCSEDSTPNSSMVSMGDDGKTSRTLWAERGVRAGQENVLRVAVDLKKATPALRLGLGVYQQSGPRVVSAGVTLQREISSAGHRYELEKYRTMKATATRRSLSLTVPEHARTGLVLGGNPNAPDGADGELYLLVDGEQVSGSDGGGTVSQPVDDTDGHTLEVRLSPGSRGTMVIAYYVALD
jgi:hypothetical protein